MRGPTVAYRRPSLSAPDSDTLSLAKSGARRTALSRKKYPLRSQHDIYQGPSGSNYFQHIFCNLFDFLFIVLMALPQKMDTPLIGCTMTPLKDPAERGTMWTKPTNADRSGAPESRCKDISCPSRGRGRGVSLDDHADAPLP